MHPLSSLLFGNNTGDLKVYFNNGTTTVTGSIVKQMSNNKFRVTDGTTTLIAKLAQTTAAATTLTAGYMTIKGNLSGGSAILTPRYEVDAVALVSGGTGNVAGSTLTFTTGTGTAATLTASTVDGTGIVLTTAIATRGVYTALPGTVTGTARRTVVTATVGTGATYDVTFRLLDFVIVNGGTAYGVGQPITLNGVGAVGGAVATVGTVDGDGSILSTVVSAKGTGIYNVATLSFATSSHFIKKLLSTRLETTDGIAAQWSTSAVVGAMQVETI